MNAIGLVILSFSVFFGVTPSYANPSLLSAENLSSAVQGRNAFIRSVREGKSSAFALSVLAEAGKDFSQDLREKGATQEADEFDHKFQASLTRAWDWVQAQSLNDLGDHPPLFPWLDQFLKNLAGKYGQIVYRLPFVQEMVMLNFAIAVVIKPRGSWQVNVDNPRIEYRKHFIPFANIVTYYASYYGCTYAMQKQGVESRQAKQLCRRAAEQLRHWMGRYVAPVLSDAVFNASNQRLRLTKEQLRVTTDEQLFERLFGRTFQIH